MQKVKHPYALVSIRIKDHCTQQIYLRKYNTSYKDFAKAAKKKKKYTRKL